MANVTTEDPVKAAADAKAKAKADADKAAAEKAAAGLMCHKATIVVPQEKGPALRYKFGDMVTPAQVAKLPQRLHRWFKVPKKAEK